LTKYTNILRKVIEKLTFCHKKSPV